MGEVTLQRPGLVRSVYHRAKIFKLSDTQRIRAGRSLSPLLVAVATASLAETTAADPEIYDLTVAKQAT